MKALRGLFPRAGLVAALFAAYPGTSFSGLGVNDLNIVTAEDLVKNLVGCGIQIGDIRFIGDKAAAGKFVGGTGIIGIEKGIVIASGKAISVVGPNKSMATSDTFIPNRRDAELEVLANIGRVPPNLVTTYDAAILEFEFIPSSTYVTFEFVFASEEYNEYANTQYNDVFGFFMNGINVALIPGTAIPVSVNSINRGNIGGSGSKTPHYLQYFIDNSTDTTGAPYNTEMDAFTTVLPVYATVKANERNLIRLAVADCSDSALNTAVFIKAGSFSSKCPDADGGTSSSIFDSSAMAVSPNPYRPGSVGGNDAAAMTFRNIPPGAAVRIYTPSGVLVDEVTDSDGDGKVAWNARNSSGKPVASGVYIYVARGRDGTVKRGKAVIIR